MSGKSNIQNKEEKQDFKTKKIKNEIKESYKLGKKYYEEVEETNEDISKK